MVAAGALSGKKVSELEKQRSENVIIQPVEKSAKPMQSIYEELFKQPELPGDEESKQPEPVSEELAGYCEGNDNCPPPALDR